MLSLICNSSPGLLHGQGLPRGQRPWHLSHSLGALSNLLFSLSVFGRAAPQTLPVSIGCGDCYWSGWQLSARLSETAFLCSLPPLAQLHGRYCSCWASFLKSFPAVSWYGKPLKLAPDCSVYFTLDKRQNTVPAAGQKEGGMRMGGHQQGLLQRIEFPGRAVKRHKCDAITRPAFYMWSWWAG